MKSKMRECDIIFRYRHCLAFITVVVFLLIYGSVAYARDSLNGSCSNDTIYSYYGVSEPIFFTRDGFSSQVNDPSVLTYRNIYSTGTTLSSSFFDGTGSCTGKFMTSFENTEVEGKYHFFSYVPNGQYSSVYSFAIDSETAPHLVLTSAQCYFISESSFSVYYVQAMENGTIVYYDENSQVYTENGKYVYNLPQYNIFFCDFPVNIASSDSSTGFNDYNYTSFSLDNYTDFNYLINDGIIIDPNAPLPPNPYENDKYYLNFDDTTYYSGGALTSFFHANNFSFNQYVLNNPVNYRLKFEYVATVKRNNTTYTFTYNPDPLQLAYFLGQSSRFGSGSRLYVPLSSDWFVDGYGHSMSAFLKGCVTDVYGTTSNYANPNDVLESDTEIVLDPYFIFRTDEYIQKSLPKVNGAFSFQDFIIDGYVNLYTNDDSNYESFSYHDRYNWSTGKSDIISTQNNVPPYEEEGVDNNTSIIPNTNSGGINYNSGSVNPTVNVTVNSGSNSLWTPFSLDQVSYANVKDMFDDIREFIDGSSENSFWGVISGTFSYIPAKIWQYMTITVAVICGFAVVRYVLRR